MAAIHLILAISTGGRWVDVSRIKWDRLSVRVKKDRTFIRFHLPFIKTDLFNNDSRSLTICSNRVIPRYCPVRMLVKYWQYLGRPTNGFVFPKNASEPINGDVTYHQIKKFCLKFGLQLPTKHTPRTSFVALLGSKNLDRERLTEALNWRHDSVMVARYLNWHLSEQDDSPAVVFASEFEQKQPFAVIDDMPI